MNGAHKSAYMYAKNCTFLNSFAMLIINFFFFSATYSLHMNAMRDDIHELITSIPVFLSIAVSCQSIRAWAKRHYVLVCGGGIFLVNRGYGDCDTL